MNQAASRVAVPTQRPATVWAMRRIPQRGGATLLRPRLACSASAEVAGLLAHVASQASGVDFAATAAALLHPIAVSAHALDHVPLASLDELHVWAPTALARVSTQNPLLADAGLLVHELGELQKQYELAFDVRRLFIFADERHPIAKTSGDSNWITFRVPLTPLTPAPPQCVLCFVLYGASDAFTQVFIEKHPLDAVRAFRYCSFGLLNGLGCHYWYAWISWVATSGPPHPYLVEVGEQVVADATLLSPVWCFTFITVMSLLERLPGAALSDRLKTELGPMILANSGIWFPVNCFTYGVIPLHSRVAFFAVVEFVYIVAVSWWDNKVKAEKVTGPLPPPPTPIDLTADLNLDDKHGTARDEGRAQAREREPPAAVGSGKE